MLTIYHFYIWTNTGESQHPLSFPAAGRALWVAASIRTGSGMAAPSMASEKCPRMVFHLCKAPVPHAHQTVRTSLGQHTHSANEATTRPEALSRAPGISLVPGYRARATAWSQGSGAASVKCSRLTGLIGRGPGRRGSKNQKPRRHAVSDTSPTSPCALDSGLRAAECPANSPALELEGTRVPGGKILP